MITGDEIIYPVFDSNGDTRAGWGETLRQKTLREFMCALISGYASDSSIGYIDETKLAENADRFTTAYIDQLNKPFL